MSQTTMNDDRIEALFFETRDLPPGERKAFLAAMMDHPNIARMAN